MPAIDLPYGVTKQIRVVGMNATDSQQRATTNVVAHASSTSVNATPTSDPEVWNIVNVSLTINGTSALNATGVNDVGQNISGTVQVNQIAADPATHLVITEIV